MAIHLIYETQSLTTDNEHGFATGRLPGRLSDRGRYLARELGERYRHSTLDAILISDLARAVETAEIAFGQHGTPIYQDARLRECNYGEFNGTPVAHLATIRANHLDEPFPGGESYRQVVARTSHLLSDLARRWDHQTIVVIAHSANKWALDHLLTGVPLETLVAAPFNWQEGWHYNLPPGWSHSPPQATTQPWG